MALGDLLLFPSGVVSESEAARERHRLAAELKAKLLDKAHTSEIYGPEPDQFSKQFELMPDPDDVDDKWGTPDESIYDEMGKNVLIYSSLRERRKDVAGSLEITFLAGKQGDPESERAREECEDAWLYLNSWAEGKTAIRGLLDSIERGFSAAENIFDVLTFGRAQGLIAPVAWLNKPRKRFGFDYRHQVYFKPYGISQNPRRVDDYKVTFMRTGSTQSRYGAGYGPRCYPSVWTYDKIVKEFRAMTERFGYYPIVARYPDKWSDARASNEHRRLLRQWKNVIMIPGEVDELKIEPPNTDAAFAGANATGQSINQQLNRLESAMSFEIQGSESTSGSQQVGSLGREQQVSSDRFWKAPSDAACIEAAINRGFIEPIMLVNHPAMTRDKWTRCVIDASFGEDLAALLSIVESLTAMEFPVAMAWASERFKIPMGDHLEPILAKKRAIVNPLEDPDEQPVKDAEIRMAEPVIAIARPDGTVKYHHPDQMIYVKGKGPRRAALVRDGDVIVDDPALALRVV